MELFCQSCGMPMAFPEHFGTNADGTPSPDYCTYYYQHGLFTRDCTMDEMMKAEFPRLKRWMAKK